MPALRSVKPSASILRAFTLTLRVIRKHELAQLWMPIACGVLERFELLGGEHARTLLERNDFVVAHEKSLNL